jgi:hypothetical protein
MRDTSFSLLDARRSVRDLRCHLLEEGDLVSALRQTVQPAASHDDVKVDVSVTGSPVRLPSPIEMNLLTLQQRRRPIQRRLLFSNHSASTARDTRFVIAGRVWTRQSGVVGRQYFPEW